MDSRYRGIKFDLLSNRSYLRSYFHSYPHSYLRGLALNDLIIRAECNRMENVSLSNDFVERRSQICYTNIGADQSGFDLVSTAGYQANTRILSISIENS